MDAKVTREFLLYEGKLEDEEKAKLNDFVNKWGENFKIDYGRDCAVVCHIKHKKNETLLSVKVKDVDVEDVDMNQLELFEKKEESHAETQSSQSEIEEEM